MKQKTKKRLTLAPKYKRFLVPALFAASFIAIGTYFVFFAAAAPKRTISSVRLYLDPASQRLQVGQNLVVGVRLNTNGQTVNVVQADLAYPTDKFDFVSIDTAGSAFEIEAEKYGSEGSIRIARGTVTPVNSSSALVATVNLRAKAAGRKIPIRFSAGSLAASSTTNTDILQDLLGGQYTIQ